MRLDVRVSRPQLTLPGASPRFVNVFLVLGSLFFGLAVTTQIVAIAGGFSAIFLVIFLAWLLSFLVAQASGALQQRLGIGRGKAITLVYVSVVTFAAVLILDIVQIGGHDAASILSRSDEVTNRMHGLLVDAQKTLGLNRNDGIGAVATVATGQHLTSDALFRTNVRSAWTRSGS